MDRNTSQGFIKGFIFTGLILILGGALASPLIGRAQDGVPPNNLPGSSAESGEATGRTDDPLGREQSPLNDIEYPPNDLLTSAEDGTVSNRTDDPLGRTRIPLVESEDQPANNLAYNQQNDRPFDPAANQAAMAREAALRQETSQQYVSPLVIPAAGFTDDGANPDSLFFPFGSGYFQGDAENYGCLVAPVYLPNGATVTDIFATVYDNDATYNLSLDFRRVDNFAGGTDTMAAMTTAGTFAGVQVVSESTITEPLVLYPDFSYYLTTCLLSGNIRLYSVRLYYTAP